MKVIWISDAEEQLRPALSEQVIEAWTNGRSTDHQMAVIDLLDAYRSRIDQILVKTFSASRSEFVVVIRLMRGYRRRPNLFLLLIEVVGGSKHGRHVVKVGEAERLDDELSRWKAWRGAPLRHDVILLTLEDGASLSSSSRNKDRCKQLSRSLVYADANQHIGAERIVTLEDALAGAILHETPSLVSVVSVLDDVYERLGRVMYDVGVERGPMQNGYVLEIKHLEICLELLETGVCRAARELVNEMPSTSRGPGKFFDPAGYLQRIVLPTVAYRRKDGQIKRPQKVRRSAQAPSASDVVPGMLVGQAHGDLHGRNVHVGIVGDDARWPAIFDYEDMSTANYIGWDFVKMETELKIRLYPLIFHRPAMASPGIPERRESFAATVRSFEEQLNLMTERGRNLGWPRFDDVVSNWMRRKQGAEALDDIELAADRMAARLAIVLLAIRRQAHNQLGRRHDRVNRWLEEYYFLLLCYGVSNMRFSNLEMSERIGSLVSAGTAAARLSWFYRSSGIG